MRFTIPESDGVTQGCALGKTFDVGGFRGIFAGFGVEPVFVGREEGKEGGLFRGGRVRMETFARGKFGAGVIDVLFESVFAVLVREETKSVKPGYSINLERQGKPRYPSQACRSPTLNFPALSMSR